MNRHKLTLFTAALLAAMLSGCSDAPKEAPKKAEPKVVAPVGGQAAAFEMFKMARAWSSDAMLLRLENIDIPEAKAEPGKYGAWKGTFVSLAKHQRRDYSYSVAESAGNLHKGAFAGSEASYFANPSVHLFAVNEVKVDTVAALAAAKEQKDLAAFAAKHEDLPVQFLLEWTVQTDRPAWRVYWGGTVSTSQGSAFIDVGTGKFIKKGR